MRTAIAPGPPRRTVYPELLAAQVRALGLPDPVFEFRFAPPRRWRFDLAWPAVCLGVEIEGVTFPRRGEYALGGRHVSVSGFRRDLEKYAEAACRGWRVLRVLPSHVTNGEAVRWIERLLGASATT